MNKKRLRIGWDLFRKKDESQPTNRTPVIADPKEKDTEAENISHSPKATSTQKKRHSDLQSVSQEEPKTPNKTTKMYHRDSQQRRTTSNSRSGSPVIARSSQPSTSGFLSNVTKRKKIVKPSANQPESSDDEADSEEDVSRRSKIRVTSTRDRSEESMSKTQSLSQISESSQSKRSPEKITKRGIGSVDKSMESSLMEVDSPSETESPSRYSSSPEKQSSGRSTKQRAIDKQRKRILESDSDADTPPTTTSSQSKRSLEKMTKRGIGSVDKSMLSSLMEVDSPSKTELPSRYSSSPEKQSSGRSTKQRAIDKQRKRILESDSDADTPPTTTSSQSKRSTEKMTKRGIGSVDKSMLSSLMEVDSPSKTELPSRYGSSPEKQSSGRSTKRRAIDKQRKRSLESDSDADTPPTTKQRSRLILSNTPKRKSLEKGVNDTVSSKQMSPDTDLFQELSEQSATPNRRGVMKSPVKAKLNNSLGTLLNEAGITLVADNSQHILSDEPSEVIECLEKLVSSGKYDKEDIIRMWKIYIKDLRNLEGVLNPIKLPIEHESESDTNTVVKILLHVPSLQTGIISVLLGRLTLAVLNADTREEVPWSCLLLRQFRFMVQIVEPNILTEKLGEILEAAPEWFQRELISYLPEIIIDSQHHTIAEMLIKLMDDNASLTAVVLDCVTNLSLSAGYLEEHRDKALEILKGYVKPSAVPAIAKFVLSDCQTPEVRQKTLLAIRSVDMQAYPRENQAECFSNQVLTMNILSQSIKVSKQMADAALEAVQRIKKEPKPFDLIMLLLVYTIGSTQKRKNIENLLRNRVRSGFYRASLLNSFYNDYKEAARELQSPAILLASSLLKASDRVFANFSMEWFRLLIISQEDVIYKQREILAKLIQLMCANEQTVRNALTVLSRMTANDDERKHLQAHSNHLRILLDQIDDLHLEEVAILNDVLYGLCASSVSAADVLEHDLKIVLDKQLASITPLVKCKGVLGAVMSIKHLAGRPETCAVAAERFKNAVNSVKKCLIARALFYDQMTDVIANTKKIEPEMLEMFSAEFENQLSDLYLVDLNHYRGEKVSEFGLNTKEEMGDIDEYGINFDEGQDGAAVAVLFRLLRTCYLRLHDGDVSSVDGLLGCPVLMPRDMHDFEPEPKIIAHIFHCINWFRELISGFVKASSPSIQEKVLKRLDQLMKLQGELSMSVTMCGSDHKPPLCYFHKFPAPPFAKIDKKTRKKGKKGKGELDKSKNLDDCELWEMGVELSCKNPAYFRRFDTEVAHLLGFPMNIRLTQTSSKTITISQVCFIIKELLRMLENEASVSFMRDLADLMPHICTKLQQVAAEIRVNDDVGNRECGRLLLCLMTAIFNWKGFHSAVHNGILRDYLRIVASQIDPENLMLRSCKELVIESCKYFESLADIATRVSIAIALVDVVQAVTQHSVSSAKQYKEKLANMAHGFLSLNWPQDKHSGPPFKAAVGSLVKSWLRNVPDPLDTVVTMLQWLPAEVADIKTAQDCLARLPSINRSNFVLLFKEIFTGLIDDIKRSLAVVNTDPERIEVWHRVASGVGRIVQVCKKLTLKSNMLLFLRRIPTLMRLFIDEGIPVLQHNLKYQMGDVMEIMREMKGGQIYLHHICCHSKLEKDVTLAIHIPAARVVLERLIHCVKAMLVMNNSKSAFTIGQLKTKNIDGKEIRLEESSLDLTSVPTTYESSTSEISDLIDDLISDVEVDDDDESECH